MGSIPVRTIKKGRKWRFELSAEAVRPDGKNRLGKPALGPLAIEAVDESEAKRIFAIHPEIRKQNFGAVVSTEDRTIVCKCLDEDVRNPLIAERYIKAGRPLPDGLVSAEAELAMREVHDVQMIARRKGLEAKAAATAGV